MISWWVDVPREHFAAQAALQLNRMAQAKDVRVRVLTIDETAAATQRERQRPFVHHQDPGDDE